MTKRKQRKLGDVARMKGEEWELVARKRSYVAASAEAGAWRISGYRARITAEERAYEVWVGPERKQPIKTIE